MKVIASIDNYSVLLQATKEEAAQFLGFANDYCLPNDIEKLLVGTEIDPEDVYKRAKRALDSYSDLKNKFESIKRQLSNLLRIMDKRPLEDEK